jgi:hypothetical protein
MCLNIPNQGDQVGKNLAGSKGQESLASLLEIVLLFDNALQFQQEKGRKSFCQHVTRFLNP